MPNYEHLTDDELLRVAEDRNDLTDDARVVLDSELRRGNLSSVDVDSYKTGRVAEERAEQLRRVNRFYIARAGFGMKFLGKTDRRPDPNGKAEYYIATLWFVVFWFPVFPVACYTVHHRFERWWGGDVASKEIAVERHPRNWQQILLTWVKAALVLMLLLVWIYLVRRRPI
jgi:hypothetical protein